MRRFVPFLLGLLFLAIALRIALFFTVVYFLAAIYILSRLWVRRVASRLSVRCRYTARAFTGDDVVVDVQVRNGSRLPIPWLQLDESIPTALRISPPAQPVVMLWPREEQRVSYALRCRKRGYYVLGPARFSTGDLLGVDEREVIWQERDPLLVYPRLLPLEQLGLEALAAQAPFARPHR